MKLFSIENLKDKKEYILENKSLLKICGAGQDSGGTQQVAGYDISISRPL